MTLKTVVSQDPPEVGVVSEVDPKEVEDLAFIPGSRTFSVQEVDMVDYRLSWTTCLSWTTDMMK
jgi:hypothetical protein